MNNRDSFIKLAITSVLALTALSTLTLTTSAQAAEEMEKCYGIVKAGMNDCQTSTTRVQVPPLKIINPMLSF
jgi:uncharacterized membrane protein